MATFDCYNMVVNWHDVRYVTGTGKFGRVYIYSAGRRKELLIFGIHNKGLT